MNSCPVQFSGFIHAISACLHAANLWLPEVSVAGSACMQLTGTALSGLIRLCQLGVQWLQYHDSDVTVLVWALRNKQSLTGLERLGSMKSAAGLGCRGGTPFGLPGSCMPCMPPSEMWPLCCCQCTVWRSVSVSAAWLLLPSRLSDRFLPPFTTTLHLHIVNLLLCNARYQRCMPNRIPKLQQKARDLTVLLNCPHDLDF